MRFILIILSAVFTSQIALADLNLATSVFDSISKNAAPTSGRNLNIRYGNAFFDPQEISSSDPVAFFLDSAGSETGRVFCGRASYDLNIDSSLLGANLFADINMTRYLLGSNYQISQIASLPFSFRGKRRVSMGLSVSEVESITVLQVYDWQSLANDPMRAAVLKLLRPGPAPVRLVLQYITHFNRYMQKAFLLTAVYPGGSSRGAHIEIFSGTVLRDSDFSLVPDFIEESAIRSLANEDLVGYAQRLSRVHGN
jgi:hypothetical protein